MCCVAAAHLALLAYGVFVHGPGWDEVGHLPAGVSIWQTGRFDLYRVNPPLVRMVAAIPVLTQDVNVAWRWNPVYGFQRPEWGIGAKLIEAHGSDYFTLLRLARLACLPFSLIGVWIVWKWSRELFGPAGGMLSVTVWAFSPIVLTNGQMMTPDTAAAALGAVACYSFRNWLREGTARIAFTTGVMLGLAELTKFTWIILFGAWPIQWLLYRIILRTRTRGVHGIRHELTQLALLFGVCVFVINLGYGFEGSFKRLGDFQFLSHALGGGRVENSNVRIEGNRFQGTVLSDVPVPFPENMVYGIDRQKVDFELEIKSYLRAEWRKRGWWYYYLYGLAVKEPAPFVILMLLAAALALKLRGTPAGRAEALNLLFAPLLLFVFVSSQTGFNHHLRYVLPAMIFFAVAAGILASPVYAGRQIITKAAWTLVAMGTLGSLINFPHSHAYFNMFVGGWRNGPWHLLDSNVDWGQDLLLLERWAQRHPDKPLDGVVHSIPEWLGVRELTGLTRREIPKVPDNGPLPGRYALSVRALYEEDSGYEYFRRLKPVAYVEHTIRVYELTWEEANGIRSRYGLPLLPPPETPPPPEASERPPEELL